MTPNTETSEMRMTMCVMLCAVVLPGCVTAEEARQAADAERRATRQLDTLEARAGALEDERAKPETAPDRVAAIDQELDELDREGRFWWFEREDARDTLDAHATQTEAIKYALGSIPGGFGLLALPFLRRARRDLRGVMTAVADGGGILNPEAAGATMEREYPGLRRRVRFLKRRYQISNTIPDQHPIAA